MRAHLRRTCRSLHQPCPVVRPARISFIRTSHPPPDQDWNSHSYLTLTSITPNINSFIIHNQLGPNQSRAEITSIYQIPNCSSRLRHTQPAYPFTGNRPRQKIVALSHSQISTQNVEPFQISNVGHSNLLPGTHCSGQALI
jgi:hypothetical protein